LIKAAIIQHAGRRVNRAAYNGRMPLRLRHRPLDLRLRHTFRIARGASDVRENLLVEAEEGGVVGRGEAAPILRYREDRASAARAVEAMAGHLDAPRAFAQAAGRAAVPGQSSAEAAVDMALHDLAGLRDTTRQRIRVDANEGWTPEAALERLEWLAKIGVELVEQPLPADRIEETRALRRRSPIPFYADESVHRAADIPRLAGAFDGINVKLMKCGGIAEALRMIAVARAHGLKVMLGCMIESSLAITAAAHLSPLVDTADLDGNLLIENDPFEGATVVDGRLVLPARPGLGVTPRRSFVP
jgi:L-alanine-DL-glutamate epimerase-like enolase superfamily enzyme